VKRFAVLPVTLIAAAVIASCVPASGHADEEASPIYGITIPQGYRDWKLISVTHEEGAFDQLRAQLGNEDNKVFGKVQAFVAGSTVNTQVMVKDSKKYAASGGWGFADFNDGKPSDETVHKACFACHQPAKDHDFVYTHYAP